MSKNPFLAAQRELIKIASLSLDALIEQGVSLSEAQYAAALEMAAQRIFYSDESPSTFPHVVQSVIESL